MGPTSGGRADELTDRALSLLGLGRAEEAERCFGEALAADPRHVGATYNGGLLRWRTGRISDDVFVAQLAAVRPYATAAWPVRRLLGEVHLERGDVDAALPLLDEDTRRQADPVAGRCRWVLDGHAGRVHAVAIAMDGSRGLSAGDDGTVRVWDLSTGRCLRTLDGHTGQVHAVAITTDGTRGLSAGDDTTVRLWDLATGDCLRVFAGHAWRVTAVAVSADGRHVLSGCGGGTLRWWEAGTGRCLRAVDGHHGGVGSVAMTADGRLGLAGGGREVRIWELSTGRRLGALTGGPHGGARIGGVGYSSAVPSVMVGADGRLALSADDRVVRIWDLATGRCVRVFTGHTDWVHSAAATMDGRLAVSGGVDATVRVWEPATARCVRTFTGHDGIVSAVAVSADGRVALSGGADGTVRVWELPDPDFRRCAFRPCPPRSQTASAADEARFAVRDVWQSRVLETHPSAIGSVAVSADGRLALSGGGGTVRVWERETGRLLHTVAGHPVGLGHDCVVLVAGQAGGTMLAVEPASGRRRHAFDGHTPRWAALSADRAFLVSGGEAGTVRVWEASTGRRVRELPGAGDLLSLQGHTYSGVVRAVAALAGGGAVVTGGDHGDGRLRLWDLATGQCLRTFQGHHRGTVQAIAATPDGRLVLSGGGHGDATVRVWNASTGQCLHTLRGHTGSVYAVAVTEDGSLGFSGDDRHVRVWDLATGRLLHTLTGHAARVQAVATSPDGNHALAGGADGTVREWEIDRDA